MQSIAQAETKFNFGPFQLDLGNRQLISNGEQIALNAKYFDVLTLLVQRHKQLTSKEYIFDHVWPDVVVTDSALSQCIKDIRKKLNDDATNPRYIKTIPKHGFMFIGSVTTGEKTRSTESGSGELTEIEARPYKFLDYFTEQDEALFFGRESEIELINSKILAHRSFIIHGRSGVGKSSIVRAGLTPRLRRDGNKIFFLRSFKDPLDEMLQSLRNLNPDFATKYQTRSRTDQIKLLFDSQKSEQFVFFMDQYEDFFLLLPEDKRQLFIESVGEIFRDESLPVKIVFVIREDMLAEMSRFKMAIPEIFHHEYRLGRLNHIQAIRAIVEPARAVGCKYSGELPERILNDLSEGNDVDPPQMQIVCDALFDNRVPGEGITHSEYDELGGASKILTGYLERVMTRFNSDELATAQEILKALITAEKTRLVLPIMEVQRRVANMTNQSEVFINALIEELGRARIVRFRRQDGEAWIEISHDFLINEISKWLTEDEESVKRARALLDRSIENSRMHQLLIDKDTLDVILPEGSHLSLNEEEAELLTSSTLKTYGPVPHWLVKKTPTIQNLILDKLNDPNSEVRIRAVESSSKLVNEEMRVRLHECALFDEDLMVRKAASIMLVEQYGEEGQKLLAKNGARPAGPIRRAISLAFVRDYNKRMVFLSRLPVIISVLVTLGLMWVRITREWHSILRETIGGTIGASLSGVLVGIILSTALSFARHAQTFEATTIVMVLISLGAIAGAFGGFGVSFGIVTMNNISFRHSHWWSVVGGAVGGFTIGGLLYILEVDIIRTLFGQQLIGLTGAYEGFLIGATLGLGRIVGEQFNPANPWAKIFGGAIGAMIGAILLTFIEGNLFSGSIEIIAKSFVKSKINLEPLASIFGEAYFGKISRLALGAMEGFLFGGFMTAGMEFMKKK
jgi:DNA-binding winged helix-turn-helix (wHTH) protein